MAASASSTPSREVVNELVGAADEMALTEDDVDVQIPAAGGCDQAAGRAWQFGVVGVPLTRSVIHLRPRSPSTK